LTEKAKNDPEQKEMAEQELHIEVEMLLRGLNVNSHGKPERLQTEADAQPRSEQECRRKASDDQRNDMD
jgi:hypothetical protein